MNSLRTLTVIVLFLLCSIVVAADKFDQSGQRQLLADGWLLKSSVLVPEDGSQISVVGYKPEKWLKTSVPSTVLTVLVKNGVYPDPRIGLNCFQIPDSSDEFNRSNNLERFSYLPDKRNPWRDPYWYRTEFKLSSLPAGKSVWLNFDAINYRADVWLNGTQIADREHVVRSFSRYRFDVTRAARAGKNCLAVNIHPVDHPGKPDTQLEILGKPRRENKEIRKDVALVFSIGYDCMPTVPDRTIGIWQNVGVTVTGPIAIRDPFVVTDLTLPKTDRAYLTVSVELVNATQSPQKGVLEGLIAEAGVKFQREVELAPGETKQVVFSARDGSQPIIENPRLWWPRNYGPQNLYRLDLRFRIGSEVSDSQKVTFGVRKITKELYELDGSHGLQVHVNGQRIFCRGGYIQPEVMYDWDAQRMDTEVRYLTEANLNLVYFEDVSNPPEEFFNACDKYGLMIGNCYYGCWWMTPGSGYPSDLGLLERSTVDITKRYRNHPSLVLYMAMNEGDTREDVYEMWRKHIHDLDGTRLFIPSGSYPDYRANPALAKGVEKTFLTQYTEKQPIPAWIKKDLPVGMNDFRPNSYGWLEPAEHFRWVREYRNHMFMMEGCSPSLPPVDSLRRFLPDLWEATPGPLFPLTMDWAHHGANSYYKPYDEALRRLHGEPTSVEDYCMKGHLVTADQHRSIFEAVNHRMWDITSGRTQWKVNACWPDVCWQIYDWYLKPMVSYYYIKRACEPLHVQMDLIDYNVSVINCRLEPQSGLEVTARVFDLEAKPLWQRTDRLDVPANSYREAFAITGLTNLAPFVFVKLELKNKEGHLVSDNFYWLRGQGVEDYKALQKLPLVKLDSTLKMETCGNEKLVHVKIVNPADCIAFFIQLALTKSCDGEEVLPVLWDDNYFSLLPGETRELTARVATKDLGGKKPKLEIGGWNIQTDYRCRKLTPSKSTTKPDEEIIVKADIADTFLNGSRVTLLVDGQPVNANWAWARCEKTKEVSFKLKLSQPGVHRLEIGKRKAEVTVE